MLGTMGGDSSLNRMIREHLGIEQKFEGGEGSSHIHWRRVFQTESRVVQSPEGLAEWGLE